jgi:hypothetical protein
MYKKCANAHRVCIIRIVFEQINEICDYFKGLLVDALALRGDEGGGRLP